MKEVTMVGLGRLGTLEELVLLALIRLKDNAYGVTIRRELTERVGKDVSIGAVYTTLERLEGKGFVSSRVGEATPQRGGRAKRFFRLEARGADALAASRDAVARMGEGLSYA
jgi:DNA-binding PadR family transcriptional regulator